MTTTITPGAITITRRQAHEADACVDDTRRVLAHLRERDGRIPRKDQRISLQDVADVLGVDGVLWCLEAMGEDRVLRMFGVRCARRALRDAGVRDARSWRVLRVAQWYAHGWSNEEEMSAARAAALAAAWDAARDAARAAADCAALATAQAASRDDVRDAAWDAERDAQLHLLLTMAGYGPADTAVGA